MGTLDPFVSRELRVVPGGRGGVHLPVRDILVDLVVMEGDATHDDGANGPEHLQHLCSRGSQLDGCDLAAVGWRVGDEDAPRDTLEQLCHEEDGERVAKEEDEDEAVQAHEARYGGPTIADPAGEGASQEDADDCAEGPAHLERRLPAGHDDVLVLGRVEDTVPLCEPGQGDEVAGKEDAVGLHDLDAVC